MYANIMREKLKADNPDISGGDLTRVLQTQWRSMSKAEKEVSLRARCLETMVIDVLLIIFRKPLTT